MGLLKELMDREKVDALAFMSEGLIKFASNWSLDVASFERPTLFVFPRHGQPFGILHELSTNSWRFAADSSGVWVSNVYFYTEHPRLSDRLPLSLQWNGMVASHLERVGLNHARIGTDGEETARIGRLPDCTIPLSDSQASRHHAEVRRTDAGFVIVDLDSLNGTTVNGVVVHEKTLEDGDVITIGETDIRYEES